MPGGLEASKEPGLELSLHSGVSQELAGDTGVWPGSRNLQAVPGASAEPRGGQAREGTQRQRAQTAA